MINGNLTTSELITDEPITNIDKITTIPATKHIHL